MAEAVSGLAQKVAGQRSKKHWISGAIQHPGALHQMLDVPQGKKIPAKKLKKAENAGGLLGQRARLAATLEHMNDR